MDINKLSIFDIISLAETRKLVPVTVNLCMSRLSTLTAENEVGTLAYGYRVIGDNARYLKSFELAAKAYLQAIKLNIVLPKDERDSEFLNNLKLLGLKSYDALTEDKIKHLLLESGSRGAELSGGGAGAGSSRGRSLRRAAYSTDSEEGKGKKPSRSSSRSSSRGGGASASAAVSKDGK